MLRKIWITSLISICCYGGFAQNNDSLTFIKAKWTRNKVAPKLKLITFHFDKKNLFAANENISYVEVTPSKRKALFAIGYEDTLLRTTSTFAAKYEAIAAVNGSFFDVKNGGSVDYIKVDSNVISPNRLDQNENRARHQQAAIAISNGKLKLLKWDGTKTWEDSLKEESVLLSGPLLTMDKQDEHLDTTAFNRLRHPRTCIGIKPNGHVILLTVDGRNENSAGMSLPELTKIMRWLGCTSSINLDGGGSTTLWVKGLMPSEVVNFPTDNKKWDHQGERKVANVIFVKKRR